MGVIGLIISLIAVFFLMIGLLPFLWWFNLLTTLPAALLGIIISGIAVARSRRGAAVTGLIISLAVFAIAIVRMIIGGGVL
ncbi:MAG: hypothetical protein A2Z29_11475 [Chloroflexi bacterium RBG_16_56_11]|nr:MAG: hypothetical protein A2Z29_11475 [Chloroflexi bacterium RBG_16_56_11]